MAADRDPYRLSSPRIFLVRILVFLILVGFVALILYRQIAIAFMANPGLNTLIICVLFVGILLALRQVWRLFREVRWVNALRKGEPSLVAPPVLLAPMATMLGDRVAGRAISTATLRAILDSTRHAARRIARDCPLSDRAPGLPRPARHVLGPARNGRLDRQRHQVDAGRRRCGRHVR